MEVEEVIKEACPEMSRQMIAVSGREMKEAGLSQGGLCLTIFQMELGLGPSVLYLCNH